MRKLNAIARSVCISLLVGAFSAVAASFGLLFRAYDALRRLGPSLNVRIESVHGANESSAPTRLVVGFAGLSLDGADPPDAIRSGRAPARQAASFAESAAALFSPTFLNRRGLCLYITRIDDRQPWRTARGELREIENELSDRFPDIHSRLQLRMDLPPPISDDLVGKIGAVQLARGAADVFLGINIDASPFPLPDERKLIAGKVQPNGCLKTFDVSRLRFELGLVQGFLAETPNYTRALAWKTTEGRG